MYCKSCGNKLRSGSKFCSKCGEVIENENDSIKASNKDKKKIEKEVVKGEVILDREKVEDTNLIYCRNCGQEIPSDSTICPICRYHLVSNSTETSTLEAIMICLFSFFIPIVGLVLWAIFKDEDRSKAKKALISALSGMLVGLLFVFFIFIFLILIFS